MLSPVGSSLSEPKMYSATYVENYLDSVDNLPNDVQRFLTRIREIDLQYQVHLKEVDNYYDQWSTCPSTELETSPHPTKRARAMTRIQQALIAAQELGDEKLRVVAQLQEVIDQKTRQLDTDYKNLEYADKDDPGLRESPSNDASPSSPSAYVSAMATANQKLDDSRGLGELPVSHEPKSSCSKAAGSGSSGSSGVGGGNGGSSGSGGLGSSNTHGNDKASAWKRSRRAREAVSRSSGSGNAFASTSKVQSDVDTMSSVSQSKVVASTSSQHSSAVGSSNINRNKGNNNGNKNQNKKRKRTSGRTNNGSNAGNNSSSLGSSNQNVGRMQEVPAPFEETIDPDEPTYCLCDQVSFGEMILCDNDLCPIEWFHFSCVSLTTKPKGKWFCPNCRGDRPSVMKPKQQFLKELEQYNREKEEKG